MSTIDVYNLEKPKAVGRTFVAVKMETLKSCLTVTLALVVCRFGFMTFNTFRVLNLRQMADMIRNAKVSWRQ